MPDFISNTLTHWTGRDKPDKEGFEIIEKIINLVNNKPTMERMRRKAMNFSRPRSAEIIAEYSFEFLNQCLEK